MSYVVFFLFNIIFQQRLGTPLTSIHILRFVFYAYFSPIPCMLHSLSISCSLIWSSLIIFRPPSLLYNGYRIFPGGKVQPGRAADHSPPSSAAVHGRVGLYLYPPSGPHRACNGITLPFVIIIRSISSTYKHLRNFLLNSVCCTKSHFVT